MKTREEIKKTILDHLVDLTSKTKQVEGYILPKISEAVETDVSQVKEAIRELEEEDLVYSRHA